MTSTPAGNLAARVAASEPPDDARWQVPAFTADVWQPRRHDYCVVVPVINEGERIASLLRRMHGLAINQCADLLIVDGGSSDGSLARPLVEQNGGRGLLTKTGPGRLSAQLRCAYAFALREGYQGIVTIDGNDKDDPAAIPRFLDELRGGGDFLQASRFIPGGVAENTPLFRWCAIRLVHAPLLSLASGFAWTDTTQGFRAYSRRLLLDPRIQPFRDEFASYELLAYLSYCAPRLGFVCQELPTTRRYPPHGSTPTKISSLRGNWTVFKTLLVACAGGYNPKSKSKS